MVEVEFKNNGVGYRQLIVVKGNLDVFRVMDCFYGTWKPAYNSAWDYKAKQGVSEVQVMDTILKMEKTDGR